MKEVELLKLIVKLRGINEEIAVSQMELEVLIKELMVTWKKEQEEVK